MMEEQCNDAQRRVSELEQTLAEAVKKERAADQRARTAQQKQISLLRELVTEREFNSSLTNNQSGWAVRFHRPSVLLLLFFEFFCEFLFIGHRKNWRALHESTEKP